MRKLGFLCVTGVYILTYATAYAGSFQLWEQTAYGTGDYHAAAAAEGSDASLEFYNPAQITELKHQQVSVGGVLIPVDIKYSGEVDFINGVTGKSNVLNAVPNAHYVLPLSERVYFAFGLTTPFGLQTDYGNDNEQMAWAATKTQLLTLNANPNFAFKLTQWLSFAAGFDLMYGLAAYNNEPSVGTPFKNKLTGWGAGYNAGVFLKFHIFKSGDTRLGASYRSHVVVRANGSSSFSGINKTVKAQLKLPTTTILSIFQPVNKRLDLMASATYTQWNIFSQLLLENTAVGNIPVYEDYRNTWNLAAGAHVHVTKSFTWKVGGGFDQTPTRDGYRDVRLPDTNHIAVSTGFHWQSTKNLGMDVGFTHLFTPTAHVDNSKSNALSPQILRQIGKGKMDANIIGGQVSLDL